jgi:glycerol uptake facilitator-like aquaporin
VLIILFAQVFPYDIVNPIVTVACVSAGLMDIVSGCARILGQFTGFFGGFYLLHRGIFMYPITAVSLKHSQWHTIASEFYFGTMCVVFALVASRALGRAACLATAPAVTMLVYLGAWLNPATALANAWITHTLHTLPLAAFVVAPVAGACLGGLLLRLYNQVVLSSSSSASSSSGASRKSKKE